METAEPHPQDGNRALGFGAAAAEVKTHQEHSWMRSHFCTSPRGCRSPREGYPGKQDPREGYPLHQHRHLLEEILLTGFLAPSWGSRCPLVVPWSLASALAVMLESFPAERAPRCPAATGRLRALKTPPFVLRDLLKN